MHFLKTFRFDATDERVFERAAQPGEWSVPGGFAFASCAPEAIVGKRRQAFQSGFLGLSSFGWSTFAVITDIDAETRRALVDGLAQHLVDQHGAPTLEAAHPAAEEEVAFAASLCHHPVNTILLVERDFDGGGNVREGFRTVRRGQESLHTRIWEIIDEGKAGP